MKTIILWFITTASSLASQIEVTDIQGRMIRVELRSVNEGVVKAEKAGQAIEFPLDRLNEASQKAVIGEIARIEAEKPKGMVVTSLAVKRIKASSIGGTFRYFFALRNHEAVEWSGTVNIRLVAQNRIKGKEGEFKVIIPANGAASGHFDASTGPPELHGEYGVTSFEVRAKGANGTTVPIDGGTISAKYIDESE